MSVALFVQGAVDSQTSLAYLTIGAAVAVPVTSSWLSARAVSSDRPFALGTAAAAAVRRSDKRRVSLTPVTEAPYSDAGTAPAEMSFLALRRPRRASRLMRPRRLATE